jgi:hypothetical protein
MHSDAVMRTAGMCADFAIRARSNRGVGPRDSFVRDCRQHGIKGLATLDNTNDNSTLLIVVMFDYYLSAFRFSKQILFERSSHDSASGNPSAAAKI